MYEYTEDALGALSEYNGKIEIDNASGNKDVIGYYVSVSDWIYGDNDEILFDKKYIEVGSPISKFTPNNDKITWESLEYEIRNQHQTPAGDSDTILFRVNFQDLDNSVLATHTPENVRGSFHIKSVCNA